VSEGRHKPQVHATPGKLGLSPPEHHAATYSRNYSHDYARRDLDSASASRMEKPPCPVPALRGLSVTRPAQMLAMSLRHQPSLLTYMQNLVRDRPNAATTSDSAPPTRTDRPDYRRSTSHVARPRPQLHHLTRRLRHR
jgi:hypothetical protein